MRNIFFDFDGTLVDISKKYYEIYRQFMVESGKKSLTRQKYWSLKRSGCSNDKIFADVQLALKYGKFFERRIEQPTFLGLDEVFGNVKVVIRKLSKMGCNVYLLTLRKNRKNLLDELKQKKLLHLFKKVLTAFPAATPCDNYKIKVRLLKKVCSASDVIIGDSRADILSGRLNKLTTIAVASGIRNRQYLRSLKPDYIIYNLRHLLKILLTL